MFSLSINIKLWIICICKEVTLPLSLGYIKNSDLYGRCFFSESESMSKMSFGHEIFFWPCLYEPSDRGSAEFVLALLDTTTSNKSTLCRIDTIGKLPGTKFLRWILPKKFLHKCGVHKSYIKCGKYWQCCKSAWHILGNIRRVAKNISTILATLMIE